MAVGLLTERWGWQPTAWIADGLPTWRWRAAPRGLLTRRQMRAEGLAPGGRAPVARVVCRRGRRWAALWDRAELVPKRVPSPAQRRALAAALAARRWCPECRRDVGYCVPTSIGVCGRCDSRSDPSPSIDTNPSTVASGAGPAVLGGAA